MVAEGIECDGSEISKGRVHTFEECASQCEGVASMFVFATNDFGVTVCNDEGCPCWCETSAMDKATCTKKISNRFRLYKYSNPNLGE